MRLNEFDALSFDCYGTLIDWEAGLAAVLGPWARRQGSTLDDEELLVLYAGHEAAVERTQPALAYPAILAAALSALAAELGLAASPSDTATFASSVPQWPAFADSAAALAALARSHRLIILSNVDRASFAGSKVQLDIEFDAVVTAEDVGSYKPDPANFAALERAARDLGVGDGRLIHVAQSLFHDHVPAKRLGLPTVWINRRHARTGRGATPAPNVTVTPDWAFPSMAAFAAAVTAEPRR